MTTQINNSSKYLTSLRVGSLQVGRTNAYTQFSLPVRIGLLAGSGMSTGAETVVVGDYSGGAIVDDARSVIVGSRTGNLAYGVNYNVLIGWTTASTLTTGGANTVVGCIAKTIGATTNFATVLGYTAQGCEAGTAIGAAAATGTSNSATSIYNTSVGMSSGTSTMGQGNTAVGAFSLRGSTAVWNNVCAFGHYALGTGVKTAAVDGTCAFGKSCMSGLTTGAHNSAFGHSCATLLTTGGYNSFFGYQAGLNITGSYNVIVGADTAGGAVSGAVALGAGVTAATDTFSIALTNAGTTFSTGLTPSTQNGGYQNCPTDCGYLLVYFNGVAKRILVYNNA